ncbi:MAG: hypothetical protein AAGC73_04900 [Verrucomicrobiota bacterium]
MNTRLNLRLLASVTLPVAAFVVHSSATVLTLVDDNSLVSIDTANGVTGWEVDGQNQLEQQWFWYRTGSDTREYSIDSIGGLQTKLTDANFNAGDDVAILRYYNSDFAVSVSYFLTGGALGSGTSDLAEQIEIENFTNASLTFTFFQYSNFDLGSSASDESVFINGGQVITQTDAQSAVSETVVTPEPGATEAGFYSTTLSALEDGDIDNLNNTIVAGVGDVTWALQWDFVIAPNSSVIISKDKQVSAVPEPGSFGLIAGMMALGWIAMRRRD